MSEVVVTQSEYELENVVDRSEEIWLAKNLDQSKVIKEARFSKETHHAKAESAVHQERARRFVLLKPFKSKGQLKPNDEALLYFNQDNAYSEEDVRRYHEKGESKSPLIRSLKPKHHIEGDEVVIFFSKLPNRGGIYGALEGLIEGRGVVPSLSQMLGVRSKELAPKISIFGRSVLDREFSEYTKSLKIIEGTQTNGESPNGMFTTYEAVDPKGEKVRVTIDGPNKEVLKASK